MDFSLVRAMRVDMAGTAIPRYLLYGESDDGAADRFIHIETIARRSSADDWTIRPHSHEALDHLFVVASGGGEMQLDGRRIAFGAAVLTVPAGAVHGFRFVSGTVGHVITIAEPLMRAIAAGHERIARLRANAPVLALDDATAFDAIIAGLAIETDSAAPLAAMASEALLQMLLVAASRLIPERADAAAADPPRRAALLVARYRVQIDLHLRDGWSVSAYARQLGASAARLRAACVSVAGIAPIRMIHERLLAEARRQLTYTDRTIAEIAYDLSFDDPAYFSPLLSPLGGRIAGWLARGAGGER